MLSGAYQRPFLFAPTKTVGIELEPFTLILADAVMPEWATNTSIAVMVVAAFLAVGRWWITNVAAKDSAHRREQDALDRQSNRKNNDRLTDSLVTHAEVTGKAVGMMGVAVEALSGDITDVRQKVHETHKAVETLLRTSCRRGSHDDPSEPPSTKRPNP